jgi:hypothetical protein
MLFVRFLVYLTTLMVLCAYIRHLLFVEYKVSITEMRQNPQSVSEFCGILFLSLWHCDNIVLKYSTIVTTEYNL